MNSDITDIAKWAQSQGWTVEEDSKGYTRFYNPQGEYVTNYPSHTEPPMPTDAELEGESAEGRAGVAAAEQESTEVTAQEGKAAVSTTDWVITFTFDADPVMDEMDFWQNELEDIDASVARIPDRGVDVTVYAAGDMPMLEAAEKMQASIGHVVSAKPIGVEIVREAEWARRAEAPTMPELMSAAEIADLLGVARQRVHQLRRTAAFPRPLAELRGGAVWDAAAVRKFADEWERRPGRPRNVTVHAPAATAYVVVHAPRVVVTSSKDAGVAGPNSREVVPNPDGGWDVRKPGADRASAHLESRAQAVDRARQILRNDGGGELRVQGRDGRIRSADTVPPGNDPYPPKG